MGLRSQRRDGVAGSPPRVSSAVARFMLGSIVAIAVIGVGAFIAVRNVAIDTAAGSTLERVKSAGAIVEASGLSDGIVRRDPAALDQLDAVVQTQILDDSIVRVKLWSRGGTILYSDEPELGGQHFGLGDDELALFRTGEADSELSDLRKPENRFERPYGKLLEAHTVIRTPNGKQVLFEIYQPFDVSSASATRQLRRIGPPLIAGIIVVVLLQVPLAWSMARRLQRGHREREALLASAVESSSRERQRIAADLHDGVVQDLAGVAFGLAPLTAEAERRGDEHEAKVLRAATGTLRQGVRDLRTLLVEIHPPNLESAGLRVALSDLLSPLEAAGIATSLEVDDAQGGDGEALVYRAAREAIRNAREHAEPASVRVTVTRSPDGTTRLVVADDGKGFSEQARKQRGDEGHLGLTLLGKVVEQSGGTLAVQSTPGKGTMIEMELPAR
jgi:signal transduction histidine kinase